MLTFKEFRASRKETAIADVPGLLPAFSDAVQAWMYDDGHVIHQEGERYFVHAWCYAPVGYPSLHEAEFELYRWYQELQPAMPAQDAGALDEL